MTAPTPFAITALCGQSATVGEVVAALADRVAARGGAVGEPRPLSLAVVELIAHLPTFADRRVAAAALRRELLAVVGSDVDLAVRPIGPERGAPRLVVFDMDSTLIQLETIDELARRHGVGDRVVEITRRAMLGELDFAASLRHRVHLLAGLDAAVLDDVAATLPLMPGAAILTRALRALGCRTAVVSGGFTFGTSQVQRLLGLDHALANRLEIVDGRVTGELLEPLVTPERKAEALTELADRHGIPLAATVAVGDGANDLPMLARAGLGVAFHAKPAVAAAADTAIASGGLDRLLYLFGLSDDDIARLS